MSGIDITVVKENIYIHTHAHVHAHTFKHVYPHTCTLGTSQWYIVEGFSARMSVVSSYWESILELKCICATPYWKVKHLFCHVSFHVQFFCFSGIQLFLYFSAHIILNCVIWRLTKNEKCLWILIYFCATLFTACFSEWDGGEKK